MLAKPMNDQKDFNSPEGKSEQILESWALILKNPQKCPRSHQNQCPRSIRMTAHDASESVPTMVQNMQSDRTSSDSFYKELAIGGQLTKVNQPRQVNPEQLRTPMQRAPKRGVNAWDSGSVTYS